MIFDSHTHSRFSSDSRAEPREMMEAALAKGLMGLCVTDHFDCDEIPAFCTLENLRGAKAALELLRGVELAQGVMCPNEAREALALTNYDYVLGSVHAGRWREDYYWLDYRNPPHPMETLLREYFENCLAVARWDKPDAIAHLGFLKRYAVRDGVTLDYTPYNDLIEEILRTLIATGKALEVNTSGFRYGLPEWIPGIEIWRRYRAMGGELVTIGSDAHRPEDLPISSTSARGSRWR